MLPVLPAVDPDAPPRVRPSGASELRELAAVDAGGGRQGVPEVRANVAARGSAAPSTGGRHRTDRSAIAAAKPRGVARSEGSTPLRWPTWKLNDPLKHHRVLPTSTLV